MRGLKVLIADDSGVYRQILAAAVQETEVVVSIQTVPNGMAACEQLKNNTFDVVLLDVHMPEQDGIETLKRIRKSHPELRIIMVSSNSEASITLEALSLGAFDFIVKPQMDSSQRNREELRKQLQILFTQLIVSNTSKSAQQFVQTVPQLSSNSGQVVNMKGEEQNPPLPPSFDLILIASSTGGPAALEKVITSLGDINKPVLIVQHMPAGFTFSLARTLDQKSKLHVSEATTGDLLKPGQALVAPGDHHLLITRDSLQQLKVQLQKTDYVNGVRPAADILFLSVAEHMPSANILCIILTGMGCDSLNGVRQLKKVTHCYCLTQDESSCIVYGMPKSIVEAGLSDEQLPLDRIAVRVQELMRREYL